MTVPAPVSAAAPLTPAAASPRVFLLVGPPGCGKGTQAARLSSQLGIPAISTGEMIRAEIRSGTPLGRIAAGVTITGGLLSDDLVNRIVASRLAQADCRNGFLLDGYPRTVDQACYLSALLAELGFPQPLVLHIDVPSRLLIERTCLRRLCPQCGHIYNLASHPPKLQENHCDQCGVELAQRADDCEETVRNRIVAYERTAHPLIAYYAAAGVCHIDGSIPPDEVYRQILGSVGE